MKIKSDSRSSRPSNLKSSKGGGKTSKKRRSEKKADDDSSPCDKFYMTYFRPLSAEFFGTMFFVFAGVLSFVSDSLMVRGAVHGITLISIVVMFSTVSGGSINPAASLGLMVAGRLDVTLGLFYIVVECLGGIAGAALARGVLSDATYDSMEGGVPLLGTGVSVLKGMLSEALLTFVVTLTVYMVSLEKYTLGPIAVGFSLMVSIMSAGWVSGGMFNPARALGPSVIRTFDETSQWDSHWIYWVGPILGAIVAAIFYRFALADEKHRAVCTSHEDEDEEHQS